MRSNNLYQMVVVVTLVVMVGGDQGQLVVETTAGLVRGERKKSDLGKEVDVWSSIPYAEAPVGNRRFLPPIPKRSWTGQKDVRTVANTCVQIEGESFGNFSGEKMWLPNSPLSEDCLYLGIVRPVVRRMERIPVMVWIYGGSFYSGTYTLDLYDPKVLAGEEEVMVVSIQYRVASLGFLYLGKDSVEGNAGLLDQLLALKWIKNNIIMFGGDPDRITLFSESAGSASVGFHLLSPLSRDLFTRAILQSATALNPWALITKKEAKRRALKLASNLGCPLGLNGLEVARDTIKCLQRVPAVSMVNAEWDLADGPIANGVTAMPFVPIIDGEFLPASPLKLLQEGKFKKTDILLGANRDEGSYFLLYFLMHLLTLEDQVTVTKEDFDKSTQALNEPVKPVGLAAIKFMYTNWMDPTNSTSNLVALDRMVGDYQFTCPVVNFAQYFANTDDHHKVYFYHFTHRTTHSPWPKWMGVIHADEIYYVFGDPLKKQSWIKYTDQERDLARTVMGYWANFAKNGDPNTGGVYWPIHSSTYREYLEISTTNHTTGKGLRAKECAFWTIYLPQLLRKAEDPLIPLSSSCSSGECSCRSKSSPTSSCNCPTNSSSLAVSSLLAMLAILLLLSVIL